MRKTSERCWHQTGPLNSFCPAFRATVAIFVVHNKVKDSGKRGTLPLIPSQSSTSTLEDQPVDSSAGGGAVAEGVWYYPAGETGDVWVDYPWETEDILEHNRLANLAKKLGVNQVGAGVASQ